MEVLRVSLANCKNKHGFLLMFGLTELIEPQTQPLARFRTRLAVTPEVMNAAPATGAGSPSERGGAVGPQRGLLEVDGHGRYTAALYRG